MTLIRNDSFFAFKARQNSNSVDMLWLKMTTIVECSLFVNHGQLTWVNMLQINEYNEHALYVWLRCWWKCDKNLHLVMAEQAVAESVSQPVLDQVSRGPALEAQTVPNWSLCHPTNWSQFLRHLPFRHLWISVKNLLKIHISPLWFREKLRKVINCFCKLQFFRKKWTI